MLLEPVQVALVKSMFLRCFSNFSCEMHGIEKYVFAGIFLSQKSFSLIIKIRCQEGFFDF